MSKRGGISAGHRVGLRYKHLRGVWASSGGFGGLISRASAGHHQRIIGGLRGAHQQGASGGSERRISRGGGCAQPPFGRSWQGGGEGEERRERAKKDRGAQGEEGRGGSREGGAGRGERQGARREGRAWSSL